MSQHDPSDLSAQEIAALPGVLLRCPAVSPHGDGQCWQKPGHVEAGDPIHFPAQGRRWPDNPHDPDQVAAAEHRTREGAHRAHASAGNDLLLEAVRTLQAVADTDPPGPWAGASAVLKALDQVRPILDRIEDRALTEIDDFGDPDDDLLP